MNARTYLAVFSLAALFSAAAGATDVSLANRPLQNGTLVTVKPNVYFILDDSGSMGDNFMPDVVPSCNGGGSDVDCTGQPGVNKYGFWSVQCNGIAYDPNTTYALPKNPDGTDYSTPSNAPNATIAGDGYGVASAYFSGNKYPFATRAGSGTGTVTFGTGSKSVVLSATAGNFSTTTGNWVLIYLNTSGADGANWMLGKITGWASATRTLTVNVTSASGSSSYAHSAVTVMNVPKTFTYSGSQTAVGYTYDSSGTLQTGTTFYSECNSNIGSLPGSGVFAEQPVYTAADRQNYVIWLSYYRVRINTMKSSMSIAFSSLANPANYRLGFTTINNAANRFVAIDDFCPASGPTTCALRTSFFNSLKNAVEGGSTPLRTALSNAGQMYAGLTSTNSGTYYWTTHDPLQYSCQRNFSIIATDGYWNTGNGYDLSGNTMANWDGQTKPTLPTPAPDQYVINTWPPAHPYAEDPSHPRDDTLADIAFYYYVNQIRNVTGKCTSLLTGQPTCNAKAKDPDYTNPTDPLEATKHNRTPFMNTFTIGLGVQGSLNSDNPAVLAALKAGTTQWPDPGSGGGNALSVDDLWHAAINGHGQYYSAKSSTQMSSSLASAMNAIGSLGGAGSGAAAANLQPVSGDNKAFIANYQTSFWYGDVQSCDVNTSTGVIGNCNTSVTANTQLLNSGHNVQAATDSRVIKFNKTGTLLDFTWANLQGAGYTATTFPTTTLSQYLGFSAAKQALMTQNNLINYLRGQWGYEETHGTSGQVFRNRYVQPTNTDPLLQRVLGDVVDSTPIYVGKPRMTFDETNNPGYSAFKAANATRTGMLYVGANDGMLHALRGDTLEELWAFVPTPVIPNLYKLADDSYGGVVEHQNYVDGPLVAADAFFNGSWHTVLVGGLGAGGKGYFAFDVTDPTAAPKLLWEFTTASTGGANLGYTFGNPIVTKKQCVAAGLPTDSCPWVVIFTSGYNTANNMAYLYELNLADGSLVAGYPVQVSTDNDRAHSGLGRIANWVENSLTDNVTKWVYGGDLYGRVWRFDITGSAVPTQLAQLYSATPGDQPIVTRPELGLTQSGSPIVFVGTGRLLGTPDITNLSTYYTPAASNTQSIYAIKDTNHSTMWGTTFRSHAIAQTIGGNGNGRTVTQYRAVNSSDGGWYVDLGTDGETGERISVDPVLQVGRLVVGTFVPNYSSDACEVNGHSYIYAFDYMPNQTYVPPVGQDVFYIPNAMVVGQDVYKTDKGELTINTRTSGGDDVTHKLPGGNAGTVPRRVSWRELEN